jgi:hypothetical protein
VGQQLVASFALAVDLVVVDPEGGLYLLGLLHQFASLVLEGLHAVVALAIAEIVWFVVHAAGLALDLVLWACLQVVGEMLALEGLVAVVWAANGQLRAFV